MVTKSMRWRRWTGYRDDLIRAADLAATELAVWHGVSASAEVAVDYADDVTERREGVDELRNLTADTLHNVRDLTIVIATDRDAWTEAHREGEYRSYPSSQVRMRIWGTMGLQLEVRGERRTHVEGLAKALGDILERGAPPLSGVDVRLAAPGGLVPAIAVGLLLGDRVPEWMGVSTANHVVDRWEGLGMGIGAVCAVALTCVIWYAFPTVQILDDGELPRHRRLRRLTVSIAGGVVLTLLGLVLDRVL